ncbi:hypothetical protein PoB_002064900 [Plakobranchus ocellatus]|uniref:Uncharacterized protein n=1 Tax=Plakobranchus ocellatus TaxID=259542 RepID=A0AAV3ZIC1_9GAST|nr:hypothetical protein PoB_002064900 [Plakobranchus ocellatus]
MRDWTARSQSQTEMRGGCQVRSNNTRMISGPGSRGSRPPSSAFSISHPVTGNGFFLSCNRLSWTVILIWIRASLFELSAIMASVSAMA